MRFVADDMRDELQQEMLRLPFEERMAPIAGNLVVRGVLQKMLREGRT